MIGVLLGWLARLWLATLRVTLVVAVFPDGAEKYLSESFWTVDA